MPVKLLKPEYQPEISLDDAFLKRESVRTYTNKEIPFEILSKVFWAAIGVNNESGKKQLRLQEGNTP